MDTSSESSTATDPRPDGDPDREPRNAIVVIPDGASSAQITAARYLKAYRDDPDAHPQNIATEPLLNVDAAASRGEMSTFPNDPNKIITDSAAAGTAMATGRKTYNGAIGGVDTGNSYKPVESILETAWDAGMATGLVTTARLTHATPAAFAAHVASRDREEDIAAQYIDHGKVDVLLGGGREHFDPDHRTDRRDLLSEAAEDGYTVVETAEDLEAADATKLLGLFGADKSRTRHMSHYLDRVNESDNTEPLLYGMAAKAIETLSSLERAKENGFFLMVEAGRVDHAGHRNDPAIAAEQLEADETFGRAVDYAQKDSEPDTVVVQAPDHETGGFSLGVSDSYEMDWSVLSDLETSAERFHEVYNSGMDLETVLGVELPDRKHKRIEQNPDAVTEVLSNHAGISWSSNTHTAESVPVYASGAGAEKFAGQFDNTQLSDALADVIAIDAPN